MKIHVTPKSSNKKTGPIPVTTTSKDTCPPTCSWYEKGCYALGGPLAIHWKKVSEGLKGLEYKEFLLWVKGLAAGTLWRHNQAGDLPGEGTKLDKVKVRQLAKAAAHTLGFTYTHKWQGNEDYLLEINKIGGFTINTSCDTLEEAKKSFKAGLPTTVMLPDNWKESKLPLALCPNQYLATTCKDCMLCARKNRKVIVGFEPHGNQVKSIKEKINAATEEKA